MWKYKYTHEFIVSKGTYYVGDLCYALDDDIYDGIFRDNGYEDGVYRNEEGGFFFVGATAFGDGEYVDTLGRRYGVDAGIIGICPIELATKGTEGGQVIEFDDDIECYFCGGMFAFTPLGQTDAIFHIDTWGDEDQSEFSE